jgi:hypothetical protein
MPLADMQARLGYRLEAEYRSPAATGPTSAGPLPLLISARFTASARKARPPPPLDRALLRCRWALPSTVTAAADRRPKLADTTTMATDIAPDTHVESLIAEERATGEKDDLLIDKRPVE